MSNLVDNTPWEEYDVDGVVVHVKREDLCAPYPGPGFSKIRGVERHLEYWKKNRPLVGVMDTRHSKAGWGVAWLCQKLDLACIDFYPVLKEYPEDYVPENQNMAQSFGAILYPLPAGMSAVLFNQASKVLREEYAEYETLMLPNGLKLPESVDATAEEVMCTPKSLLKGTWVISISSGTIAAGVARGLAWAGFTGSIICHMGYSRSPEQAMHYMQSMAMRYPKISLIDEHYEYKDAVDNSWIPFPCNEYYDAKAFLWLAHHVKQLQPPVVFWNIGD